MSTLLSDADLNDFISPGLACVKPATPTPKDTGDEIEVGVESMEKVSISLQDCLACSGCITSSEEIMLSKQSYQVFLDIWNKKENAFVGSISPQSRVSLANHYGMTTQEFDSCFMNLMISKFGFKYMVGTELGRIISIKQMNEEIVRQRDVSKPLLSSVCPGFVLYAEKTKPEVIPNLLNVKSPQQITGNILKKLSNIEDVYHLSIMPCFDKKLEASRDDEKDMDVDCVITPKEFVAMLDQEGINFRDYQHQFSEDMYSMAAPPTWPVPQLTWYSNGGSSSGGYAEQYIAHLQNTVYSNEPTSVQVVAGKNADVVEYRLLNSVGEKLGSSSIVYGFRNIQNLVRKFKPSKRTLKVVRKKDGVESADPYSTDFVEVMACPGGCINGGGLMGISALQTTAKQLVSDMNGKYSSELTQVDLSSAEINQLYVNFYSEFTQVVSPERLLRYKFHEVKKSTDIVSVGATW